MLGKCTPLLWTTTTLKPLEQICPDFTVTEHLASLKARKKFINIVYGLCPCIPKCKIFSFGGPCPYPALNVDSCAPNFTHRPTCRYFSRKSVILKYMKLLLYLTYFPCNLYVVRLASTVTNFIAMKWDASLAQHLPFLTEKKHQECRVHAVCHTGYLILPLKLFWTV